MTMNVWFLVRFYACLRFFLKIWPYRIAVTLLELSFRFFSLLSMTKRKHVRDNLQAILALRKDKTDSVTAKEVSLVFGHFGRYMAEFWGPLSWREEMFKNLSLRSKEYLDQARNTGKPIILLSSHTGNWELGAWLLARMGLPMAGLYWAHPDPHIQIMVQSQRVTQNLELLFWREHSVVSDCNRVLREGKILAIVADIDYAMTGIKVNCSGLPIRVSRAPAVFAKRAGAIILPSICVWSQRNHEIIFEEPVMPDPDESIEKLVQKIAAIYIKWAIQYPYQRLVFRSFGD
ncbi:MAG: lysophospholipid acyltransferase family protein [Chlamydiota bacterium]|nr:lysophospholipid acyltransferase family protein [Chlamydiota bacterium]